MRERIAKETHGLLRDVRHQAPIWREVRQAKAFGGDRRSIRRANAEIRGRKCFLQSGQPQDRTSRNASGRSQGRSLSIVYRVPSSSLILNWRVTSPSVRRLLWERTRSSRIRWTEEWIVVTYHTLHRAWREHRSKWHLRETWSRCLSRRRQPAFTTVIDSWLTKAQLVPCISLLMRLCRLGGCMVLHAPKDGIVGKPRGVNSSGMLSTFGSCHLLHNNPVPNSRPPNS